MGYKIVPPKLAKKMVKYKMADVGLRHGLLEFTKIW